MKRNFIINLCFLIFAAAAHLYADDKQQTRAVERIETEVSRSIARKNSSPIQFVLRRYRVRDAFAFSGVKNESDSFDIKLFLPKKRPAKVALAEWNALRKSRIALADSENNSARFTLLDLDEDGLRDLVIETYAGGTGLYSYFHVYRRRGGRFEESNGADTELYSINGRGSDQEADWVRINGRVYLAYRNGAFGKDELFLLRAFGKSSGKMKGLIVEYDYRHYLPRRQKSDNGNEVLLEPEFYAALLKSLNRLQKANGAENDYGKCPAPENLSAERREEYDSSWFGPPHYTYEVAAEFPVFEKNRCSMAQLISFKSSYLVKNKFIETALWLLRQPNGEREEYDVESVRAARRVKIADLEYPSEDND